MDILSFYSFRFFIFEDFGVVFLAGNLGNQEFGALGEFLKFNNLGKLETLGEFQKLVGSGRHATEKQQSDQRRAGNRRQSHPTCHQQTAIGPATCHQEAALTPDRRQLSDQRCAHYASRSSEEQPGETKSSREQRGAAKEATEQPGRPGSSQGAAREHREQPGSSQGTQAAAREAREQPWKPKNSQPGSNQSNHGVTAPCTGQLQDNYRTTTGQPTGQLQDNLLLL